MEKSTTSVLDSLSGRSRVFHSSDCSDSCYTGVCRCRWCAVWGRWGDADLLELLALFTGFMVKISFQKKMLGKANAMSTILKILKFEVHEIGYTSSNGMMVIMTPSHRWFMGWRLHLVYHMIAFSLNQSLEKWFQPHLLGFRASFARSDSAAKTSSQGEI